MEVFYSEINLSQKKKLYHVKGLIFKKVPYYNIYFNAFIKGTWVDFEIPILFDFDQDSERIREYSRALKFYNNLSSSKDYLHSQITHHAVSYIKENFLKGREDYSIHEALNTFVINKRYLGYLIL